MKLSIIIVNYNVRYFLEQCLQSVYLAIDGMDAEIFVVDNLSTDDSLSMLRTRYPGVKLMVNHENVGFAKANNQAIRQAQGEYILLLNPDTILAEDALRLSVDFMDKHPKAGGLGVKMVDGYGRFLPESKRGLPTPFVSFCKVFGLSRLFPKSKIFGRYHLGYLDANEIHSVDILAGAYMMMRHSVLEEVGLLDETFFMYGEDIDLSYRIILGGYENYYFPLSRMVHYKGESTKKSSLRYIRIFYQAMIIFARKHYRGNGWWLSVIIHIAVYLRASMAAVSVFFKRWYYAVSAFGGKHSRCKKSSAILVIGKSEDAKQLLPLLDKMGISTDDMYCEEQMEAIHTLLRTHIVREIIFSKECFSYREIIAMMEELSPYLIDCKIAYKENQYLIGSDTVLCVKG